MSKNQDNRITFVAAKEVFADLANVPVGSRSRFINRALCERKDALSKLSLARRRIIELEKAARSLEICQRCDSRGSYVGRVMMKDVDRQPYLVTTVIYCECGAGQYAAECALAMHARAKSTRKEESFSVQSQSGVG